MSAIKVYLHLVSRWTYYTAEQREIICLLVDLDKTATLGQVLCQINSDEVEERTLQSLLTLMRTFTPASIVSEIESGHEPVLITTEAPNAVVETPKAALESQTGPVGSYHMAAIRITEEEVTKCKTQLYVPENIYRFVKGQANRVWTSSQGTKIQFQQSKFDYCGFEAEKVVYLPKKCTTQVVCLEDEVERPDLDWDWDVVHNALNELYQQVKEVDLAVIKLGSPSETTGLSVHDQGARLSPKNRLLWKRDTLDTTTQTKVELFMSRAALLYIHHQDDSRWTAANGVRFACFGGGEMTISERGILFSGRQGDTLFTVPPEEWKKSKWTPEQVRDALAELSQTVLKVNQSANLVGQADMEVF